MSAENTSMVSKAIDILKQVHTKPLPYHPPEIIYLDPSGVRTEAESHAVPVKEFLTLSGLDSIQGKSDADVSAAITRFEQLVWNRESGRKTMFDLDETLTEVTRTAVQMPPVKTIVLYTWPNHMDIFHKSRAPRSSLIAVLSSSKELT